MDEDEQDLRMSRKKRKSTTKRSSMRKSGRKSRRRRSIIKDGNKIQLEEEEDCDCKSVRMIKRLIKEQNSACLYSNECAFPLNVPVDWSAFMTSSAGSPCIPSVYFSVKTLQFKRFGLIMLCASVNHRNVWKKNNRGMKNYIYIYIYI